MEIRQTLEAFDAFLNKHSQQFEATIIGGSALNLLAVTDRVTRDVDILNPASMDPAIAVLAKTFAQENNLPESWINNGPAEVANHLPKGWEQRTEEVFTGSNLTLKTLGRLDLLMTKCWAYCDRERDLDDVLALKPSDSELEKVRQWLQPLDGNELWPQHVNNRITHIQNQLKREQNIERELEF